MTLVIELDAEQEARLAAAPERRGVAPTELAREILAVHRPPLDPELDLERTARLRSIRGKYARLGVSIEDLHRERLRQ